VPTDESRSQYNVKYVKEKCEKALALVKGGVYFIELATTLDYDKVTRQDIDRAYELIADAQNALDDPFNHGKVHPVSWLPEHKREVFQILEATRFDMRHHRGCVETAHTYVVKGLLAEAWRLYDLLPNAGEKFRENGVRPRNVSAKLRETQAVLKEAYIPKPNRESIRKDIQQAWDAYKGYLGERQEHNETKRHEWEERQAERAKKNAEWRERQSGHIKRWSERIENQKEFIRHLRDLIAKDRERQVGARSADFADTVQGWINEKESKISSVVADIEELQERIADVSRRLDEDRD
jgi:hypothetical protein